MRLKVFVRYGYSQFLHLYELLLAHSPIKADHLDGLVRLLKKLTPAEFTRWADTVGEQLSRVDLEVFQTDGAGGRTHEGTLVVLVGTDRYSDTGVLLRAFALDGLDPESITHHLDRGQQAIKDWTSNPGEHTVGREEHEAHTPTTEADEESSVESEDV